jgi:DNA-binding transcriptional MocR family regulator
LESRVGELPDETAAQALASAKQNEELFNKQIEGIRKEYKEREDLLQQ